MNMLIRLSYSCVDGEEGLQISIEGYCSKVRCTMVGHKTSNPLENTTNIRILSFLVHPDPLCSIVVYVSHHSNASYSPVFSPSPQYALPT